MRCSSERVPKRVSVTWQWLTRATVTKQPDGVLLKQDGQALRLRVLEPAWIDIEDVSQPKHVFDSPNPGLSRIILRARTDAGKDGRILVLAEPQSKDSNYQAPAIVPLAKW